ncbi:MAG: nucleoside 2-deoxyribosyltransferase [Nanoarchaeota archaeon]
MKIYFAGSIRGGRGDAPLYLQIIEHLRTHGEVLTEHVGDSQLSILGEDGLTDEHIHNRDLKWLTQSNVIVAEVTNPSLGVGYEIGRTVERGNQKILCLYRAQEGRKPSAMIAGCQSVTKAEYKTIEDAKRIIDSFFDRITTPTKPINT